MHRRGQIRILVGYSVHEECLCVRMDGNLMKETAIKVAVVSPSRVGVHQMFDRISKRYDLLNHVLSLGLDAYWRRAAIRELDSNRHLQLLDLACGTGDIAMSAALACPDRQVIGIDRAERMLGLAKTKVDGRALHKRIVLACGDGMNLPLAGESMDAVTIAFGIRNMPDTRTCLREICRVLRPQGKVVVLEFSLPSSRIVKSLHLFYLRRIVPLVGRLLSGDSYAYRYLNETIETYPHGMEFCELMQSSGYSAVKCRRLNLGIVSLYTGTKI